MGGHWIVQLNAGGFSGIIEERATIRRDARGIGRSIVRHGKGGVGYDGEGVESQCTVMIPNDHLFCLVQAPRHVNVFRRV